MKHVNTYQQILGSYLLLVLCLWGAIHLNGLKGGNINFTYSFMFGLIPLFGGLVGMPSSRVWGGLKSALGKAVFFISLGLFCWGFGETIWSYYNFVKHVAAPYPSLADIGFAPSIFFWVIGALYLSKATGAWLVLKRSLVAKVFALIAIVALSGLSYYILVTVGRGGVLVPKGETLLKTILDIAYPLGDLLALIFAFIVFTLSFKYFGGFYRWATASVLAGLAMMYAGDFIFSWTTTLNTFYNADAGDLVLTLGLFLLTFGVLGFAQKPAVAKSSAGGKS